MPDCFPRFGLVVVFSGPSGAGKTTVYRQLLEQRTDLAFSVSCTTRPPRPGEVDGTDYHFVDRQAFLERVDRGEFLEWAEVHGNLYGTPRPEIERRIAAGLSVILDIDVQGARQVRQRVRGGDLEARTLFIFTAPSRLAVIEERLRRRATDAEATIARRLANTRREMQAWREYDYLVVNDGVDEAVADLAAIIDGARQRIGQLAVDPWPELEISP